MIDDSQLWLIIGVTTGAVAIIVFLGVIVNSHLTSRRIAAVLGDVEEVIHSDFKGLEAKVEAVLTKIRIAEAKAERE